MTTQEVKRKLAAILSADVKGYSRLMGEDEKGTVRILNAYKEVMAGLIQNYHGRVVDAPGDNVLAEFASVVDAVECAAEIQKELKNRNAELPENRRMEFRIGVNLGDVIEDGEQILGDGVNIAARLESLSEAGGICISGTAFDQVRNKLELGYDYLGEKSVKNIALPVRAYKVLMEPEAAGKVIGEKRAQLRQWQKVSVIAGPVLIVLFAVVIYHFYFRHAPSTGLASKKKMAFPLPDKPSIAVLPFANLSGDPGQDFLVDGITENVITTLSSVPRLFIIARHSTFTYKGKAVKVQKVAEELGVRYVLEGSIMRSGNRVRVTVQLIDALKGHQLWAGRYDREMKDLFSLQDDLTSNILRGMQLKLTSGEQALHSRPSKSLEVWLKYLEGSHYTGQFNIDNNNRARVIGQECIAMESDFWGGYLLLGCAHMMDYLLGSKDPAGSLNLAIKYLEKAAALTDRKGVALMFLGHVYAIKKDYDKAIKLGEQAIALIPNGADAHVFLAIALNWAGRPEEALPLLEKAMRLNPLPPSFYYLHCGTSYRMMGRFEEAVAMFKKSIQLAPNSALAYQGLACTYGQMGRGEEAKAAAAELLRINPKFTVEYALKTSPFKETDQIEQGWRKAGLK